MVYSYLLNPVAAEEYEDAFNWYEKKSYQAADNFIIRFQDAISAICADPYRYRNNHSNLREIALKKYPYYLIYYIDDTEHIVVVVSVFNQKRNPATKYKKK